MWVNDKRVPDPASCDLIADALGRGVTIDDVLIAAGHKEPPPDYRPNDRREQLIARLRAVPDGYGVENALETMLAIVEGDIKERRKGQRG